MLLITMYSYKCLSLLILVHLVILSINGLKNSFQMKKENLNKRLFGYKLFEETVSGHHACACGCMFLGACKSINFIASNKTCEFNSEGSESVGPSDFVESKRTTFSDITEWPMSMAGGCALHECGSNQRCFPLGGTAHKCINITCGEPQPFQYGTVQLGSKFAGSVRLYTITCPDDMFLSGNTSITCLLNGEWTELAATCKVTTLGSSCENSMDCHETGAECIAGLCFCSPLYRYNAETKECDKVCSAMETTFTLNAKTRIAGYNDREGDNGVTYNQCLRQCVADDECLSFEYKESNGGCNLGSVTIEMIEDTIPEKLHSDSKDLYSRDCV